MYRLILLINGVLLLVGCGSETATAVQDQKPEQAYQFYVGTYTEKEGHVDGHAAGIYRATLDGGASRMTVVDSTTGILNPSWVISSRDGKLVYAVSETGSHEDSSGHVYAYAVETKGLKMLNRWPTGAHAPCHIALSPDERVLVAANYVGGVVSVFQLADDGSIASRSQVLLQEGGGDHPEQDGAHPHQVVFNSKGSYFYVPDKGADAVFVYQYDAAKGSAKLVSKAAVQAGSGPRHMVIPPWRPNRAFVLGELDGSVSNMMIDSVSGGLVLKRNISALWPDETKQNHSGEILAHTMHPNVLFVTHRGPDQIAIVHVRGDELVLVDRVPAPAFPRGMGITPDGKYLLVAGQNSDELWVYSIGSAGVLKRVGTSHKIATPVSIWFAGQ
jgi:6-phosphogluconolactonase